MDYGVGIKRALKGKGVELVVQVEEAQYILARTVSRRQF